MSASLLLALTTLGAAPVPPDEVGNPVALAIWPTAIVLEGPRSTQQVLVTGRYANGSERDLTRSCTWRLEASDIAELRPQGLLVPHRDGSTTLVARVGSVEARASVHVRNFALPQPVSFRREVMPVLSIAGCNAGSCHGIPSGRNGFRLSLWGNDPSFDFVQLTHDALGRRTSSLRPEDSLVLQKALGRVPHEGGRRFSPASMAAAILTTWQSEGRRDDPPSLPALMRLEVAPASRVLHAPACSQQLAVTARYADGSIADVTRLTVFTSSEPAVARADQGGLISFSRPAEVAILCRYQDQVATARLTQLPRAEGIVWISPPEHNYVDHHVFAKLREHGIAPSELCTDAEFLRRAYFDVCGRGPTPDEARAFFAAPDRPRLIETLLARPEYADFWSLKWADVLRVTRKFIQPAGARAYRDWLCDAVRTDMPLDQMARALLLSKGHSYKDPPANYYAVIRTPRNADESLAFDAAETTAQLFLGVRMKCAKCHNHPFERWTQDDYWGLAAFFVQVKQQRDGKDPGVGNPEHRPVAVLIDPKAPELVQPRSGKAVRPKPLGAAASDVAGGKDRREALADWLVRPDNPFFARSIVNRLWFHLMGKGIVDPVDDFRESNPPSNDALLDALAQDFIAGGFRARATLRTILNSRTYQLSSRSNASNQEDTRYFSHVLARSLTAEQLLDAICDVTGVPEVFEGSPPGTRAVQLPDGEVIASKGRYLNYERHPFMKQFGQPDREIACECGREADFTLNRALELMNGPTVTKKLRHPENRLAKLLVPPRSDAEALEELYLAALARRPTQQAARSFLDHVARASDKRQAWEDVLWVILRSREFVYRH